MVKEKSIDLLELRKTLDSDKLILEEVDIWPFLKNYIFFFKRRSRLLKTMFGEYFYFTNHLRKSEDYNYKLDLLGIDIIFFCDYAHRTNYSNSNICKQLDSIMDITSDNYCNKLLQSCLVLPSTYESDRVLYINKKIKISYSNKYKLSNYLINVLDNVASSLGVNRRSFKKIFDFELQKLFGYRDFYLEVLKKSDVKSIFMLCYYSTEKQGMTIAANSLGINTIDVQHGGIGEKHPAYFFQEKKSYRLLPKYFWVWDSNSKSIITKWSSQTNHKVFCGGNPDILLETEPLYEPKKIILITLSWGDISKVLPDFFLNAIIKSKDSHEYVWYIRFHPRSSKQLIRKIQSVISKLNVDNVEFDKSNDIPLFTLLKNSWAHISQSSGSLSEANLINVPINVVTSELGSEYFKHLVQEHNLYYYVDKNTNLFDYILSLKPLRGTEEEHIEYLSKLTIFIKTLASEQCD